MGFGGGVGDTFNVVFFFSSSCFYLLSRMLVLNVLLSSVLVCIWDV